MNDVTLSVRNLVVDYGELRAVSDVSFDARAGSVTAVLGPNGAGKTTTMEVCCGVRSATSGSVSVLGLHPKQNRLEMNARIGVMLQEGGVYPSARVGEVLEHYCHLFGDRERADELLSAVDLTAKRTATWRQLSGGERQRLSLALALAARPEIAFLDEPTSGVDVAGRDLIRGIVRNLATRGCAVVLATHELDEAERLADHVVMFQRGKLIADASLTKLQGNAELVTLRSSSNVDIAALASHLGCRVEKHGDVIRLHAKSDAQFIARLSTWFSENLLLLQDLRSGLPRLEDIYRQLTDTDR